MDELMGISAERPFFCRKTLDREKLNRRDCHETPGCWLVFAKTDILKPNLGWDTLDLSQGDLLSFCVIYYWLCVRLSIAHLAQDGRFPCICLADDEDTKLTTLGADVFCI